MAKIRITLKKSTISTTKRQKANIKALGLSKIGSSVEHEDKPQIRGMANKVLHLVTVEEI
jgi:large subunit ribosomal protein L30